ncbi:MAG: pilin [bacterium]|nr:pilin [bacterium]
MKRFFALWSVCLLFVAPLLLFTAAPASASGTCWCSINSACTKFDTDELATKSQDHCNAYCINKKGTALAFDEANFGERTGAYCQLKGGEPPHCWCLGPEKCEHHVTYKDDKTTKFTCAQNDVAPSCNGYCKSKGDGWKAIHCDDKYYNQEDLDNACAKANGKAGSSERTVQNNTPSFIDLSVAINGKTSVNSLPEYILLAYRYAVGIAIIAAIVMVVYGGFRYLLGSAIGSVEKGKKIILDAIMGMIIVLGAWLILNTVSPATVTLQVPGLITIAPEAETSKILIGKICYSDGDCGKVENGVACILYSGKEGLCSDGSEWSLCACSGEGCKRTDDYLNNKGARHIACGSGLACMSDLQTSEGRGYRARCQKASQITGGVINDKVVCGSDKECQDKGYVACLAVKISNGALVGFCTKGEEGDRCRCFNGWCPGDAKGNVVREKGNSTEINSSGMGFVSCQAGLECMVTNGRYTDALASDAFIYDGDWYCQKSVKK